MVGFTLLLLLYNLTNIKKKFSIFFIMATPIQILVCGIDCQYCNVIFLRRFQIMLAVDRLEKKN